MTNLNHQIILKQDKQIIFYQLLNLFKQLVRHKKKHALRALYF